MFMKKISFDTIYLILVISIGLVGLGVGSTFAMFTASARIDNPISFTAGMKSDTDVLQTIEVTIPPGEIKNTNITVNNSTIYGLNYIMWYIDYENNVDFGLTRTDGGTYQSVINANSEHDYKVSIRNNGQGEVTIVIGVSSSRDNVILGDKMVMIPYGELPEYISPLSDFEYVLGGGTFDNGEQSVETVPSNEVWLTKYIGTSSVVGVPATYTIQGVTYNTVLLSLIGDETSGVFMDNTTIKEVYINNNVKISDYRFDYSENEANELFYGCTNLEYVNNIPSTVTSMYYAFDGCTNLTGTVNILSENVSNVNDIFTGTSKAITVNVPNNTCTTYTKLNALTTSNGMPSNVTLHALTINGYTVVVNRVIDRSYGNTPQTYTTQVVTANNLFYTTIIPEEPYLYYDSISCTNGQVPNVNVDTDPNNLQDTLELHINNVTSDTVCTVTYYE